jgi:hypothetical protein
VTKDEIVAKAVFRYWPLNQMKVLNRDNDTYYDPDSTAASGASRREFLMGTWGTRGLRGSLLEEMINLTNETYRSRGLA